MITKQQLLKALKDHRRDMGISITQLAGDMGYQNHNSVYQFEENGCHLDNFLKWIRALDLDVVVLKKNGDIVIHSGVSEKVT